MYFEISEPNTSSNYFNEAAKEYTELVGEGIDEGTAYLNFLLVRVALRHYQEAIELIRSIDTSPTLSTMERDFVYHRLFRMALNPHLTAFLSYVTETEKMSWNDFVQTSVRKHL
jgi:hypothetical protein